MRTLRILLGVAVALAIVGLGCQPKVLILNVQASNVQQAPAKVTVTWKLSAGKGELSADKPVKPALVPKLGVDAQGSLDFEVCETTTFKLEPHYGGQRTTTVTVVNKCGTGSGTCTNPVLQFTGTCPSAGQGPVYSLQTVSPNVVTGNLKDLLTDADFPIHVAHLGQVIPMSANGGPLFPPIPPVLAAGDYAISVPGAVGQKICADATGPTGGGDADVPVVTLTVFPNCPKP